ncbi:hypothetical protein FKV75_03435 [Weissella paramesenteroides]|nr:hypothetical protein FKV81_04410 [Weissella paramesenteroides]KAA8441884.1 hypothetical protein FKV77_06100 [Weissella paramesenteroides]KAA8443490.1 hypothetical protein FKV75_03435 [Weissella paramesenteroides]KAA8447778.1 hypothetical protein FKV76_03655 [Weissella paramesenteroides]KAA8449865.1 hypothetical protein FKV74_06260 [Weissella paramesenteroides]
MLKGSKGTLLLTNISETKICDLYFSCP